MTGIIRARLYGHQVPISAIVNLTDRCNLKCTYCYASYYKRGTSEMTTAQVCSLLSELKKSGCRRVSIAGGEPLLRKDIGEILAHISRLGLLCTVNSNGLLVPQRIDFLQKINTLCLSLDGNKQAHDIYRGKGSHQGVMDAIDVAKEHELKIITNTVLHRANLDQIDNVLDTAKQKGFKCLFNLCISLLSDSEPSNFKAEEALIRKSLRHLIELKKRGAPILNSVTALKYCLTWPDYDNEFFIGNTPPFPYISCLAGQNFITVDTNGDVYPCAHLMNGKFVPANALQSGITTALQTASNHNCTACYHIGHTEFNLLFALRVRSIINILAARIRSF